MLCTQPQPVDVIGQLCFVGVGGSGKQVSGQVYFPQRPQRIDYQNIRVQIQDTLNEILKHKDLDKSTVKELVDACKISRQSFYYHFQVIMDVVEWYQNQALKQSIEQSLAAPMYKEAIRGVICETFQHKELILNQLLTEMDGFEGNNGVIILVATNRPESLAPAFTRPARLHRGVRVEPPDLQGREAILKVHARKIKVAEDVDFNKIARMASGASGAELANIVNEAALGAVRDGRGYAPQSDLEESIEVVIAGYQKKNAILTDKEKWTVSYHEIGHALVAAKQTNSAPVQKITIIPRTSGALGYTMQVEEGNHYLLTKEEMENKIATYTGGRAAEEVAFGTISTGASNDIEQVTKMARAMIARYGMSKDFDMVAMETVTNQYLVGDSSLTCSMETQTEIDRQVVELVKQQHKKAISILEENRAKLDELAKYLYEKETITGEEFMEILNQ